jgi:hypothetical protein
MFSLATGVNEVLKHPIIYYIIATYLRYYELEISYSCFIPFDLAFTSFVKIGVGLKLHLVCMRAEPRYAL